MLSFGIDAPSSVLAFSVVRALTGSPGLVRRESTGFMSTVFTHEPLARLALVSSARAAQAVLPCTWVPERSAATGAWPEAWAPASDWATHTSGVSEPDDRGDHGNADATRFGRTLSGRCGCAVCRCELG